MIGAGSVIMNDIPNNGQFKNTIHKRFVWNEEIDNSVSDISVIALLGG